MLNRSTIVILISLGILFFPLHNALAQENVTATIFKNKLQSAEQGDIKAQTFVGFAYLYGLGTERDEKAAIRWYKKAASRGSAEAMSQLGSIYGRREDYARSYKWFHDAAALDNSFAIWRLGIMYQKGWHVHKDNAKALNLITRSAWLNSAEAQHYLGALYAKGELVPKSYVRAYAWLSLAAAQNEQYAGLRDLLEKRMAQAQIGEAQKLAVDWADKIRSRQADTEAHRKAGKRR